MSSRAEYVRRWRQNNPEAAARARRKVEIRRRALIMLGQIHAAELAELIAPLEAEEREEEAS